MNAHESKATLTRKLRIGAMMIALAGVAGLAAAHGVPPELGSRAAGHALTFIG